MKITQVLSEEDYEREILCLGILESLSDSFEFELVASKEHRIFRSAVPPRVKKIPLDIGLNSKKTLRDVVILARFFARSRPDVAHFHSGGALMLSARLGGVRNIVASPPSPLGRSFFSLARALSVSVVSHSGGCTSLLNKSGGGARPVSQADFFFRGAEFLFDLPQASEDFLQGRRCIVFDVRREDGIRTCMLALSRLLPLFRVAGVFILREERFALVRRIASSLGMLEHIVCLSPDRARSLKWADCLCFVCMTDGVLPPLSLVYFMSRGVPPLVAYRSVNSEYVKDGESGLSFYEGDASSLFDRLQSLCLDSVFRFRLSFGAYRRAEKMREKEISLEYSALYTSSAT